MKVPSELVPRCPICGKPMTMNLRADDTFVQDEGWPPAIVEIHSHELCGSIRVSAGPPTAVFCAVCTPAMFSVF